MYSFLPSIPNDIIILFFCVQSFDSLSIFFLNFNKNNRTNKYIIKNSNLYNVIKKVTIKMKIKVISNKRQFMV